MKLSWLISRLQSELHYVGDKDVRFHTDSENDLDELLSVYQGTDKTFLEIDLGVADGSV